MKETGGACTGGLQCGRSVPGPPGVVMVAPPEVLRNTSRARKAKGRAVGRMGNITARPTIQALYGPEPRRTPARPIRVLLLQQEGYLHIGLVACDVAVLYHDVHILNPAALHASKRLGSTGYGLVDGILEARL